MTLFYSIRTLPISSGEITKRLKMWLNNPQCGHKEREKFPMFCLDPHLGKYSHIWASYFGKKKPYPTKFTNWTYLL